MNPQLQTILADFSTRIAKLEKTFKEITDEEIMELSYLTSDNDPIDFARAILRKAQEK